MKLLISTIIKFLNSVRILLGKDCEVEKLNKLLEETDMFLEI